MPNEFEKPQSRNESILQNMLGAKNELVAPESRIEALLQMILEQGSGGASFVQKGSWLYKVYADGIFEAWCTAQNQEYTIDNVDGAVYRSALTSLALPQDIYESGDIEIKYASLNVSNANYITYGVITDFYSTGINYYVVSNANRPKSNYLLTGYVIGKIN